MNLEALSLLQRNLHELTSFPERERTSLILATDFEGPLVLGDTAADVMSRRVRPLNGNPQIDYGRSLYFEEYEWYTHTTLNRRRSASNRRPEGLPPLFAQEGTDITSALAPLLAMGADQAYINHVAMEYKQTPGSAELLTYLRHNGARVVAVTTAWQEPNEIIAQQIGIDGLVGTPFPIDQTKTLLESTGRLDEEMQTVDNFLKESFFLIEQMSIAQEDNRELLRGLLHQRIEHFYTQDLGISYDPVIRERREVPYKTVLGAVIESIGAVGDRTKAAVAQSVFRNNAADSALTITMGDGLNDQVMLGTGKFSIGLNGADAAKAAKIGIVTQNVRVLIPVIEILSYFHDRPLDELIRMAQEEVGRDAIIHRGGPDVPESLLQEHKKMKKQIRQDAALIP